MIHPLEGFHPPYPLFHMGEPHKNLFREYILIHLLGLASLAHAGMGVWGMYPPLASLAPTGIGGMGDVSPTGIGGMGDISPRGMYPPPQGENVYKQYKR